ncbi:MAG: hypothetical protein AAF203_03170, partial [Pseudomonadota bacterium]
MAGQKNKPILSLSILWVLAGALLSQCTTLQEKNRGQVQKVMIALKKTFPSQQKEIWADYNPLDYPIIFISKENLTVIVYEKGQLGEQPYDHWKPYLRPAESLYDFIKRDQKDYLVVFLNRKGSRDPYSLLNTVLHEGFHLYYQNKKTGWKEKQSAKQRGTIYPIQSTPR